MKNDLKSLVLMLAVACFMVLFNPIGIKTWITDNLSLEVNEFDRINEYGREQRERLEIEAAFIRNEEWKTTMLGTTFSIAQLKQVKMESAGLVYDEEGSVVNEEDLGTLKAPYSFLIIGSSSMLEGLGPRMQSDLEQIEDMTVYRHGKYSSGLTRPDFYNWNVAARQDIADYQPQAIIVQFGGNDGQTITDVDGNYVSYKAEGWDEAYAAKVETFMQAISSVDKIYWIELPIGGNADFAEKFKRINGIQKSVLEEYSNVVYVKCWDVFAPHGYFESILTDKNGVKGSVKHTDGVHLTKFGSAILSDLVITEVKKDLR